MVEDDRKFYELRPLTNEEIHLIRTYIKLDSTIVLLDQYEEQGESIAHVEDQISGAKTDYDMNVREIFIMARKTIADVAFQQGFAMHLMIAMEHGEE